MPNIQLLMLSTWSGQGATERKTWVSCRLMWWEGFWKGDCDLRSVVDEVYDTSSRMPGSKVGEILVYVGLKWVDRGDVGCTMVY